MTEKTSLSQDVDDWLDKQSETLDYEKEEILAPLPLMGMGEDFLTSIRPMGGDQVDGHNMYSILNRVAQKLCKDTSMGKCSVLPQD